MEGDRVSGFSESIEREDGNLVSQATSQTAKYAAAAETTMNERASRSRITWRKRDLFADLTEGFAVLAEARDGKRTLRTHAVPFRPAPEVTPKQLVEVRE